MQAGAASSNNKRVGPVGFQARGLEARKQVSLVLKEEGNALAPVYLSGDQAALDEKTLGRLQVRCTSTESPTLGLSLSPPG
jgi:hypothetical protein